MVAPFRTTLPPLRTSWLSPPKTSFGLGMGDAAAVDPL
jgi:hypothetical protein